MFQMLSLTLAALITAPAFAFEWTTREVLPQAFELPPGQTRTVPLNGTYNIKKLLVQARASSREGGFVDVYVNGDQKSNIYLPGTDPTYVVTVNEVASSIEFVSRAPGYLRIEKISATISDTSQAVRPPPPPMDYLEMLLPRNELTAMSHSVIRSVDALSGWTSSDDKEKYLQPIKSSAGRLLAMASSRGMASGKTAQRVQDLIGAFDFARPYLDRSLTCRECFDETVKLLSVRERLEKALQ